MPRNCVSVWVQRSVDAAPAHAVSGTPDVSAAFEDALTTEVGSVAATTLRGPTH